jgi:protein ImuA
MIGYFLTLDSVWDKESIGTKQEHKLVVGHSLQLHALRRAVAEIEGSHAALVEGAESLAFGIDALDAALAGGLAYGAVHEVAPSAPLHLGAAAGFLLALSARAHSAQAGKTTLWIKSDFAGHEGGEIYGPGLALFGLPLDSFLILHVARPADALWAMEEALKCRALVTVIAEMTEEGAAADLTATRRLALAARDGGVLGLLLRHRATSEPSAAATRWEISAAASKPDAFGGLGRTAFTLSLNKNRRGPVGRWTITWDHHERTFSPLSVGVAQAAFDRPDRAPLVRAG